MKSSTVRIDKESDQILHELAKREGVPMREIIYKALVDYKRRYFLIKCADGYATLKADSKEWDKEVAEREEWDSTISDGVEKENG